jgi:hypothetical protein
MSALLERDRLFFKHKGKLIELNTEFSILDEDGAQIGWIRQGGQSALKKVARLVSSLDQFFTHTLAVYEGGDARVLRVTRPAKVFKSRVLVEDGASARVGTIVQQNVFGKIRFAFEDSGGSRVGGINAENWRAWNFSIVDAQDREVGRITKKFAGLTKAMFTSADHYLYEIQPSVSGPLRLLGLASAVGIDLALKQDARGLG